MVTEEKFTRVNGPFCDLQSHNLVLQLMAYQDEAQGRERLRRDYLASSLDSLLGNQRQSGDDITEEASGIAAKIKELLEKRGPAFRHTLEFYAAIEDDETRKRAYRGLMVVTSVPQGEDAEIAKNPFRFLNLPEDATFGQTRAAWIRLGKIYHPDIMNPQNEMQRKLIFGDDAYSLKSGLSIDEWIKVIDKLSPPDRLSASALERLSPEEREEYNGRHEDYRQKELEYERVRTEMRVRAHRKMQIINKAYEAAKNTFSSQETETLAGYDWISGAFTHPNFIPDFKYRSIQLEGDGEIRCDAGEYATDKTLYLAYDWGDIYLTHPNYRQSLSIRTFFAWMELRQGREISPMLLDDIVEHYKMNEDQAEQLRLMLMNREEPGFMIETLGVPIDKNDHYNFLQFVELALYGPVFYHLIGPDNEYNFSLGVELTAKGRLILSFMSQQEQCYSNFSNNYQAHFTPADMKLMATIAYGPLLQ